VGDFQAYTSEMFIGGKYDPNRSSKVGGGGGTDIFVYPYIFTLRANSAYQMHYGLHNRKNSRSYPDRTQKLSYLIRVWTCFGAHLASYSMRTVVIATEA
jgi:hypothetical protein